MADSCNLPLPTASRRNIEPSENKAGMTALEKQIVSLVVAGYTNKESAAMVGVSQGSLRHQTASIMSKLGVVNRLELVLVALHNNLVDPIQQA